MDITKIKKIFEFLDTSQSGYIDIKELSRGVRGVGLNPSEADIRTLLSEAETDDNGELDYFEFKRLCERCNEIAYTNKDDVRSFLMTFDDQNTGFLSPSELKKALMESGEQLEDHEIDGVLRDFEKNPEGRIEIEKLVSGLFSTNNII